MVGIFHNKVLFVSLFVFKRGIFSDQPVHWAWHIMQRFILLRFQFANYERSDMFSSWFSEPDTFYRIMIGLGVLEQVFSGSERKLSIIISKPQCEITSSSIFKPL